MPWGRACRRRWHAIGFRECGRLSGIGPRVLGLLQGLEQQRLIQESAGRVVDKARAEVLQDTIVAHLEGGAAATVILTRFRHGPAAHHEQRGHDGQQERAGGDTDRLPRDRDLGQQRRHGASGLESVEARLRADQQDEARDRADDGAGDAEQGLDGHRAGVSARAA
ncbi:hypothetical protein P2Q00_42980 [Streptomyces coacervatus]|nr:hypothetical protein [Streptomyces coacervatus]MDF2272131.1 hypothetical protein [Streptomyces coacervatus]